MKVIRDQEDGCLPEGEIARWPFERAASQYVEAAALRLRPGSVRKEAFFLVRPIRAFGTVTCEKISAVHIQRLQAEMKGSGCKNTYVNLVVGATVRVLRFAKTWRRIRDDVIRLSERTKPVAHVLTPEEKARLFQVAARNPNWISAYVAVLLQAAQQHGVVTCVAYDGRTSTTSTGPCRFPTAKARRVYDAYLLTEMRS